MEKCERCDTDFFTRLVAVGSYHDKRGKNMKCIKCGLAWKGKECGYKTKADWGNVPGAGNQKDRNSPGEKV